MEYNEKEITLIKEFMGIYLDKHGEYHIKDDMSNESYSLKMDSALGEVADIPIPTDRLYFNSSYNLLMPVVMKILTDIRDFEMRGVVFSNGDLSFTMSLPPDDNCGLSHDSLIDAIYKSVVCFINWDKKGRPASNVIIPKGLPPNKIDD